MVALIVFGGLPGSGKSSIARELARETGAIWLRIDSIEQAIRESGVVAGSIDDAGYRAAYAIADENLRLGRNVIGDCVNGWSVTRNAWRDTGVRAGAQLIEVEIMCSDPEEHRRRVETRDREVPGLLLPNWQAVNGPQLRTLGSGSPNDRHCGTQHRRLCKPRPHSHVRTSIS
jgi:predicted kinase